LPACAAAELDPASPGNVVHEEWYAIYLNGVRCGHQHLVVVSATAGEQYAYETRTEQEFTIARGPAVLEFALSKDVREREDGTVWSFDAKTAQGPMVRVVEGRVEGDELVVLTSSGGSTTTSRVRRPEGLCQYGEILLRRRMGLEAETTYSYAVFVPDFPERDAEVSCRVVGEEMVEVGERQMSLHRIEQDSTLMPGLGAVQWVDDGFTDWVSRATLGPGMEFEFRRVSKQEAAGGAEPAQVLRQMAIRPDKPIPNPRSLQRLVLLFMPAEPDVEMPQLPSGPHQEAKSTDEGLRVTVRAAAPARELSYELPCTLPEYAGLLSPNAWMELDDPLIAAMAREVVGARTDALAVALRLEEFVGEVVTTESLGVGMASAAETARRREGDCTEHAVLLAALARAAGIPSRVAVGVAYVEDFPGVGPAFGYHMWVEAYVGTWLPLDPVFGGFDATHVTFSRSDMNEAGTLPLFSELGAMLVKWQIRVVEATWGLGG
jgi:transglutaminase-like putative cysteine protease